MSMLAGVRMPLDYAWSGEDGCMNETDLQTRLCARCAEGPLGETGHAALALYVAGPYPGHHIFKCADCNERWIRHYGDEQSRHAWTRHVHKFPEGVRRVNPALERGKAFPF